jgi:CHAT domain-containing protein
MSRTISRIADYYYLRRFTTMKKTAFRRGLLVSALLFFQLTVDAQTSWQPVADRFIRYTLAGPEKEIEAWDSRDSLEQILAASFHNGNQDFHLTCLLALWQAQHEYNPGSLYYESAIRALSKKPLQKALFLMDHANAIGFGRAFAVSEIKEALELFSTAGQDSSQANIQALCDYTYSLLQQRKFNDAKASIDRAKLIAERRFGKTSQIYQQVLNRMQDYYIFIGNSEQAVFYQEEVMRIESDELGPNRPYIHIFPYWLPYSSNAPMLSAAEKDLFLAAGLYSESYTLPYRKFLGVLFYEELLQKLNQRGVTDNQTSISAMLIQAEMDLLNGEARRAVDEFEVVNRHFASASRDQILSHYQVLNFLGCAYYDAGKYGKALETFEKLHALLKKNIHEYDLWSPQVIHNLILTNYKLGNREKVTNLLKRYWDEHESTIIENGAEGYLLRYGDILFAYKDFKKAAVVYNRAHSQMLSASEREYEREKERARENGMDDVMMIDERNVEVNIAAEGVENLIHKFKPQGRTYAKLLYRMAQTSFLNGQYQDAADHVSKYINEFFTQNYSLIANRERGTDLYEIYRLKQELFPAYDLYQNILWKDTLSSADVEKHNAKQAFVYALDSKANLQYEYRHMREAIENGSDNTLKADYNKYLTLRARLARIKLTPAGHETQADSLSIAIDTLKAQLSSRTALVRPLEERFVFWSDIRGKLKRNEAAIEIKRFNEYKNGEWADPVYVAYIISPGYDGPQTVFFKDGTFLEKRAVRQYHNSIRTHLPDTLSYSFFWRPIQQKLPGIWKAYLAPDGVYNQINVQTLYDSEKKKFLVDKLKVVQSVTTKDLLRNNGYRPKIKKVTLMGRPAYFIRDRKMDKAKLAFDNDSLRAMTRDQIAEGTIADLPGTEKEVATIDKLLKANGISTNYLTGTAATEEGFKQSKGDVLHVATHGFWFKDANAPLQSDAMLNSGLLFAGVKNYYEGQASSQEDGILTAYEVQGMNLSDTRLVILSACETALGEVEAGEGVHGLQRAFRIAGVEKMIMSLWKVDDTATQELFTSFYKYWLQHPDDIRDSFEKAIQDIKIKYNHPHYWGAFVVIE